MPVKLGAAAKGTFFGSLTALLAYGFTSRPATLAALALRHSMPNAWFSGMMPWCSLFICIVFSASLGIVVFFKIYKLNCPHPVDSN